MGDTINLTLEARKLQGKKVSQLRRNGLVPGVVYGHGMDPTLVQVPYGPLDKVVRLAGKHSPVHIELGAKKRISLIKDVDRNPVTLQIQHVSFHAVKANEIVTAEVPIHLIGSGESAAEKAGLIILQAIESVEVKAKPADLPDSLEISIAELESAEDRVTFADIALPKGVEYADVEQDLELVIASVYEPAALEAANEAAAGDATEAAPEEAPEEASEETASE